MIFPISDRSIISFQPTIGTGKRVNSCEFATTARRNFDPDFKLLFSINQQIYGPPTCLQLKGLNLVYIDLTIIIGNAIIFPLMPFNIDMIVFSGLLPV